MRTHVFLVLLLLTSAASGSKTQLSLVCQVYTVRTRTKKHGGSYTHVLYRFQALMVSTDSRAHSNIISTAVLCKIMEHIREISGEAGLQKNFEKLFFGPSGPSLV